MGKTKRGFNRAQGVVLAFFVAVFAAVVVINSVAPEVMQSHLRVGDVVLTSQLFIGGLALFLLLPITGVIRRWRWIFWLVLASFLGGVLRVPASGLELMGVLPTTDPTWYICLQAGIGLLQVAIGILMLRGYRKAGPWGAF